MPTGSTTTDALADSLPDFRQSARLVREFEGVMPNIVDRQRLGAGQGLNWNEVDIDQLTAQAETEGVELNNPQQYVDTLRTLTPTSVVIQVRITDRVKNRISPQAFGLLGAGAQNAIQRKKDEDGITVFAGASVTLAGTGTTLASGHLRSGTRRISSNVTEPGPPPFRIVLHGFQIKDVEDEITSGVGTYPIGEGLTSRVFTENFQGMIGAGQVYEDGNIAIVSNDARGAVFAEKGIILVEGASPKTVSVRREDIGYGGVDIFHRDEYIYGERLSAWVFGVLSDATAPTS